MYYVIETNYVGPNPQDHLNDDVVGIYSVPGRTNMSREIRAEGWLGTTNDWAKYARGEYDTVAAARAYIEANYYSRPIQLPEYADDDLVESYTIGMYEALNRTQTEDWIYEGILSDVDADTTDERIAELVAEYEGAANAEGLTIDKDAAEKAIFDRRQDLRDA